MRLLVLSGLALLCVNPTSPQGFLSARRSVAKVEIVSPTTGLPIDTVKLEVGDTGSVACKVTNQYGSVLKRSCSWVALTTTRATVSPASGEATTVRGVGNGTTRVIASTASKADTVWVVVTDGTIPPPPSGAISIAPGESWQAKVDANPTNTVFRVLAGTHVQQAVTPKSGQQFIADSGAIMDGRDITDYAFNGAGVGVVLRNLEITRYDGGGQLGAIQGYDATGWVLDHINAHDNTFFGANLRTSFKVIGGTFHHNGQYGLAVTQVAAGSGSYIDGAELSYNNLAGAHDPLWDAGGIKVSSSNGMVIRNTSSHHNNGPGLWYDINNQNSLLENNTVTANTKAGIFYEISMNGIIRWNTVTGNGTTDANHTGSNILVSASRDVEVSGNTVSGSHGIIALQEGRGNNSLGQLNQVVNLWVHDNTVTVASGKRSGLLDFISTADGSAMVSSRNNRFDLNDYTITGNSTPFYGGYGLTAISQAQWQALGKDLNSTFVGP